MQRKQRAISHYHEKTKPSKEVHTVSNERLEKAKQIFEEKRQLDKSREEEAKRKNETGSNLRSYMQTFKLLNSGEVILKQKVFRIPSHDRE